MAGLDDAVDGGEHAGLVVGGKGGDGGVDKREVGDPQQRQGALVAQAVGAGAGEQLIQDGEAVAGAAATGADDQGVDSIVDVHALRAAGAFQQPAHGARREQPEWIMVGARTDRADDLVRFGGGEDEDEVLRWFLHDLEHRVETLRGDHVRLIDDEHPVARLRGGVMRLLPQLTHVIHTVVAGGVELGDIQIARPAGGQGHTRVAHSTRGGGRPLHTVQGPGQDACRRCLATPTRTREQVGVIDASTIQRDGERGGHMLLPHHLVETCRSILAIQSHALSIPGQTGLTRPASQDQPGLAVQVEQIDLLCRHLLE